MGEYAYYGNQRIKIGTCENMLYLRWDHVVRILQSDVDFTKPATLAAVRFRFPWPDEDDMPPGDYEDPFRGFRLDGFEQPPGLEHGTVQFTASNGYLLSLPCPEAGDRGIVRVGDAETPYVIHKNGYGGPARLIQQAWRGRRLVSIVECGGCKAPYRLEDGYEEAAAVAIRSKADQEIAVADRNGTEGNRDIGERIHTIADRLLAGYAHELSR